jgi:hypothetical protein
LWELLLLLLAWLLWPSWWKLLEAWWWALQDLSWLLLLLLLRVRAGLLLLLWVRASGEERFVEESGWEFLALALGGAFTLLAH